MSRGLFSRSGTEPSTLTISRADCYAVFYTNNQLFLEARQRLLSLSTPQGLVRRGSFQATTSPEGGECDLVRGPDHDYVRSP